MTIFQMLGNEDGLAWLGVAFTCVYFVLAYVAVRMVKRKTVVVVRYAPPDGISPAAAAWLVERGELPRAMCAAILSLVAKRVLTIQRVDDIYTLQKISADAPDLAPEEQALMYAWFRQDDIFSLPVPAGQLANVVQDFGDAVESVLNPVYFTKNLPLYLPAWILSGMTALFALYNGNIFETGGAVLYVLPYGLLLIGGMFFVGAHSCQRTLRKIGTYIPGRDVPRRPINQQDLMPIVWLSVSVALLVLLAGLTTFNAAGVVAALLALNAIFIRTLWAPTPEGREVIYQIEDYKKFLTEVDADPVTRLQWPDGIPLHTSEKVAYALAFGIDLGWGERFVTTIAESIESASVFIAKLDVSDNPKSTFTEIDLK
jgi:hypothetical protein